MVKHELVFIEHKTVSANLLSSAIKAKETLNLGDSGSNPSSPFYRSAIYEWDHDLYQLYNRSEHPVSHAGGDPCVIHKSRVRDRSRGRSDSLCGAARRSA